VAPRAGRISQRATGARTVRMEIKFAEEDTKLHVKTKDIFMPALSSTMTEGKIVQWLKKPGEKVAVGEIIMVVESDKADMDVESFEEGYLATILTQEGGTAGVGETVALLAENEEDIQMVIECGTECIVPGSNHRHDGTTGVDLSHEEKEAKKKAAAPAAAPAAAASSGSDNGAVSASKPKGTKEVFMPALSSTMTEGKIVQWLKKEGDSVAVGESVMVVESDKADMDVESFDEGVLAHISLGEGGSASVGDAVAYLAPSPDQIEAVKKWASSQSGGGGASASAVAPPKDENMAPAPASAVPKAEIPATPAPQPQAPSASRKVNLSSSKSQFCPALCIQFQRVL